MRPAAADVFDRVRASQPAKAVSSAIDSRLGPVIRTVAGALLVDYDALGQLYVPSV